MIKDRFFCFIITFFICSCSASRKSNTQDSEISSPQDMNESVAISQDLYDHDYMDKKNEISIQDSGEVLGEGGKEDATFVEHMTAEEEIMKVELFIPKDDFQEEKICLDEEESYEKPPEDVEELFEGIGYEYNSPVEEKEEIKQDDISVLEASDFEEDAIDIGSKEELISEGGATTQWSEEFLLEVSDEKEIVWPDIIEPESFTPPIVFHPPIITELMAINEKTIQDEDGDYSDWIEIYNPDDKDLSLSGYHITDNLNDLGKWTFPDVKIKRHGYLVVFASGKDRKDPNGNLHTNFKLNNSGETVVLVNPEMQIVSMVTYPIQAPDVSYGPIINVDTLSLITINDKCKYLIGTSEIPQYWRELFFDDKDWKEGDGGIGFDLLEGDLTLANGEELGKPTADSLADWSDLGEQGFKGWYYGFYNRTQDPDHTYSAKEFYPFPRSEGGFGQKNYWNGVYWDWYGGDPPWTAIGKDFMHPNGVNNGVEHWAIRRWVSYVKGPLFIQWNIAKKDPSGSGVTGRIFRGDSEVDKVAIDGSDTQGVVRTLVLPNVSVGETIDFCIDPTGPSGDSSDISDSTIFVAGIWLMPNLSQEITTDIAETMYKNATSMFIRYIFSIYNLNINRLFLKIKYDDGFAAYINGKMAATFNAPMFLSWDSKALEDRPIILAKKQEIFDLREQISLLKLGKNILAIQVLNSDPKDSTCFLSTELEGKIVEYNQEKLRYYAKPTPGYDNDPEAGDTGPIIVHLTKSNPVKEGSEIEIKAQIISTGQPVTSAEVTWRIMWGQEQTYKMTPLGSGIFYANIPTIGAKPGDMIRWFITATSATGKKTRAPKFDDPLDSEEYYGTIIEDPTIKSKLPVLHWFVQNPSAANTWTGTRCSVYFGGEFYDNIRVDLHGQSTAGFPKKSYDMDFNSDHRFLWSPYYKRMKDINLLTNYADKSKIRNTLAYETHRDVGTGYHLAYPIRVQRNGSFFEVADFVEDADDVWLERLGLDRDAPLYKMYDGLYSVTKAEKKNRKWEDKSDLQGLIDGLNKTGEDLRNFLYDNINIPEMVNFYVSLTITSNMDCCHKNYYVYRDVNGSKEWWYLPWDVDLSFGRLWNKPKTYFDDTMYPELPLFGGGGNKLSSALWAQPEFKEMYLRRLRTVMDELQQPPSTPQNQLKFEKRIDELVAEIGEDGALDYAAWPKWGIDQTMEVAANIIKTEYMPKRREFLYNKQAKDGNPGGGPIPPPQGNPILIFGEFEISDESPDYDYFTVVNPNDFAVDVSGYQVRGDVTFVFRKGTVIPSQGVIYISPKVSAFRARTKPPTGGKGLFVVGDYGGTLYNPEWLLLFDAQGNLVTP